MNSIYWHLPPLVLAVSYVYAATRHEDWKLILQGTLYWVYYILSFLGMAFIAIVAVTYLGKDWWKPALAWLLIWGCWKFYHWRNRQVKNPKADKTKSPNP